MPDNFTINYGVGLYALNKGNPNVDVENIVRTNICDMVGGSNEFMEGTYQVPTGSCLSSDGQNNYCGEGSPNGCFCDEACLENNDCCSDFGGEGVTNSVCGGTNPVQAEFNSSEVFYTHNDLQDFSNKLGDIQENVSLFENTLQDQQAIMNEISRQV